jgi:hypothetical protein
MITNSPALDFCAWLLFWSVLVWAVWQGAPELARWLARDSDSREDIHFFPDEERGEPGPEMSAAAQRKNEPSGGAAAGSRQAR